LTTTDTDSFLVLHEGKIVCERYLRGEAHDRHILFSVSKSVTGTLAGILVGQGKLDPAALVTRYVPEVAASAYDDCTVRHLLDMTAESGLSKTILTHMVTMRAIAVPPAGTRHDLTSRAKRCTTFSPPFDLRKAVMVSFSNIRRRILIFWDGCWSGRQA
jgi:CubicO group peptidase (beta-lactamase class C family)